MLGKEVIYVDVQGEQYDAVICGPLKKDKTGRTVGRKWLEGGKKIDGSKCEVEPRVNEVVVERGGNFEKAEPQVSIDLLVHFPNQSATITGVCKYSDLKNTYKKPFYKDKPAPEPAKAPEPKK